MLSVAVIEDIVLYVVLAVAVGLVQTGGSEAFGLPAALNIHGVAAEQRLPHGRGRAFPGRGARLGGRVYGR